MIPFEFTVKGPPLSQQAKSSSRNQWKTRIARAALQNLPNASSPVSQEVAISIAFY